MPTLTSDDGRKLAWREVGSGPPLLLHPGGPGMSARSFGELPELAAERTLVLLDPRGAGNSDRPADPAGYDLEDYVADVEAVRAHLAIEPLDLLGHSHGGWVATTWAAENPDRLGRLVLASTAARFTDAIRESRAARIESHRDRPYFEDARAALEAHRAGRFATDEELAALYRRDWRLLTPPGVDAEPILEVVASAGANADALRHFNTHVAPGLDVRPLVARIEAPTLVISGELEAYGPTTSEEIAAALPNATRVVIAGAEHFPFLEPGHRAEWSRAVLDFLSA